MVEAWLGAEGRGWPVRVPHSVFHCCEQLPEKQFREGRFILAQVPEGSQFPVVRKARLWPLLLPQETEAAASQGGGPGSRACSLETPELLKAFWRLGTDPTPFTTTFKSSTCWAWELKAEPVEAISHSNLSTIASECLTGPLLSSLPPSPCSPFLLSFLSSSLAWFLEPRE